MAHKKGTVPEWFPFAIVVAFFGVLGAGSIARWRLSGDTPKPPTPPNPTTPPGPPPVAAAGVLQDWGGVVYRT